MTFAFKVHPNNIQTSLPCICPIFLVSLPVQFHLPFPPAPLSIFLLSLAFMSHFPLLYVISTFAISVSLLLRLNPLIIVPSDWIFVSVCSLCLILLLLWSSYCPSCLLICTTEESLKTHTRHFLWLILEGKLPQFQWIPSPSSEYAHILPVWFFFSHRSLKNNIKTPNSEDE